MKEKFVLSEYTIPAGLQGKLTIGLVSDLHESDPREALRCLHQGKPDLIMVAGDTFERHGKGKDTQIVQEESWTQKILRCALMKMDDLFDRISGEKNRDSGYAYQFLQEAGQIAPVFLSVGNHEWYFLPEDWKVMKGSGAVLLDNDECEVRIEGILLRIGGLSSDVDPGWLERFCEKDGYKILLCHHPEYYDRYLKEKPIDLILSGHAHGGQIRIGNRGIYAPGQGLFPKYTKGIYHGKLIVTTGASNTASVPRWGNPCEAVMVHLERR